jgi:hypothetical protein
MEHFDHALYAQGIKDKNHKWFGESDSPSNALKEKSKGLLDGVSIHKLELYGQLQNQDTYADVK